MKYDRLFEPYFKSFEEEDDRVTSVPLPRGLPIRSGDKMTWKEGNCAGDPPNDPNCKGGYFCNLSSRQWQCKT